MFLYHEWNEMELIDFFLFSEARNVESTCTWRDKTTENVQRSTGRNKFCSIFFWEFKWVRKKSRWKILKVPAKKIYINQQDWNDPTNANRKLWLWKQYKENDLNYQQARKIIRPKWLRRWCEMSEFFNYFTYV